MAAKPKSPTADLKQAPAGMLSPKSQNFEFESAPPGAAADLDSDEQEMLRVLKNPPAEARTDPAWRAYVEIGYITKADVNVWTEFMACAPDDMESHLQERGPLIVQAFLKMLSNIQSVEARKYLLTVLDQCCLTNKRRWGALFASHLKPAGDAATPKAAAPSASGIVIEAPGMFGAQEKAKEAAAAARKPALSVMKLEEKRLSPYAPLFIILRQESTDSYTQARALHILSTFFVYGAATSAPHSATGTTALGASGAPTEEVRQFVQFLTGRIPTAKGRELLSMLMSVKEILKSPDVRRVWLDAGGLKILDPFFKHEHETRNTQHTYVAAFAVWLLSYNKDTFAELKAWNVVGKALKVVMNTNREKCLRIGFAILVNLAQPSGGALSVQFQEDMVAGGLVKFIDAMGGRKIKDEDLIKDIDELRKTLEEAMMLLSSFEKYQSEVDSGKLQFSPVHVEQFWRENSQKFEEKSFEYIKKVILLLDNKDELTLQVACTDLGEFARFHPDGKRIITQFGGKTKLMSLMSNKATPTKVASAALLAVQKLMVNNWEHLAPAGSKKSGAKTDE